VATGVTAGVCHLATEAGLEGLIVMQASWGRHSFYILSHPSQGSPSCYNWFPLTCHSFCVQWENSTRNTPTMLHPISTHCIPWLVTDMWCQHPHPINTIVVLQSNELVVYIEIVGKVPPPLFGDLTHLSPHCILNEVWNWKCSSYIKYNVYTSN